MKKIRFLTLPEVIALHKKSIDAYGGVGYGLRDKGLLESALAQPKITVFGEFAYKTIHEMAAAYLFGLIKNHPFVDGNKRIGLLVTLVFIEQNGYEITATPTTLYNLAIDVASSQITQQEIVILLHKLVRAKVKNS